jgi:hypothetical protein
MIKRVLGGIALSVVALAASAAPAVSAPQDHQAKPTTSAAAPRVAPRAASPVMSPAANRVEYHSGGVRDISCTEGYLCVDVWDPTRSTYKVFFLYTCATRHLSYFHSTGYPEFKNNQTTGTVTRFLGQSGNLVASSRAKQGPTHINWDPVWSIDVC